MLCASECYDYDMYFCRYLCYQPYPVSDGDCNTGTTQQVPSQTPVRAKLMACVYYKQRILLQMQVLSSVHDNEHDHASGKRHGVPGEGEVCPP